MADVSITQVLADAAQHVGDPAQLQFSNGVLTPFFGQAFREVYSICKGRRLALGQRIAYVHQKAYTNQLNLAQAGITDIGRPTRLWERTISTAATVTGMSSDPVTGSPIVLTVSPGSGLASNQLADVTGVVGPTGVNDEYFITVSGNSITLNGSVAGGAYVSGGQIIQSQDYFHLMQEIDPLPQWVPAQYSVYWRYMNQKFYLIGATNDIELKIEYSSSGAVPLSGNVGIDDSQNVLGFRTAALAAADYDMPGKASYLNMQALGPSGQPDGTGGALYWLVNSMLLEKQNRRLTPGTFRPRRNNDFRNWFTFILGSSVLLSSLISHFS